MAGLRLAPQWHKARVLGVLSGGAIYLLYFITFIAVFTVIIKAITRDAGALINAILGAPFLIRGLG